MHPVNELKHLREQMVEQLTQIPEYQALKAMERFIGELTSIYEAAGASAQADPLAPKAAPVAHDMRGKHDPASPSPRVTPYIPAHRVA
jgi:hypothetical protein